MPGQLIHLRPVIESKEDYDRLEKRILAALRKEIYTPLFRQIWGPASLLRNSIDKLHDAIRSGRITYARGRFTGSFSAGISKELKALGAEWDPGIRGFRIPKKSLPVEIRVAIDTSYAAFEEKLDAIDKQLSKILPEKIAGSIKIKEIFDKSLWKVDRDIDKTLEAITITPKLTDRQREKIATEWAENMRLSIKGFTEKEVLKLRRTMQKRVFAGNRYESAINMIQASYGVSERKARFLARQETSLLMAKYKESRYTEAGVYEYKWACVAGSKLHPVRPSHKKLDGKIFRWDDPPVTTPPGETERRNNPGQDYNCRCMAIPIVRRV